MQSRKILAASGLAAVALSLTVPLKMGFQKFFGDNDTAYSLKEAYQTELTQYEFLRAKVDALGNTTLEKADPTLKNIASFAWDGCMDFSTQSKVYKGNDLVIHVDIKAFKGCMAGILVPPVPLEKRTKNLELIRRNNETGSWVLGGLAASLITAFGVLALAAHPALEPWRRRRKIFTPNPATPAG